MATPRALVLIGHGARDRATAGLLSRAVERAGWTAAPFDLAQALPDVPEARALVLLLSAGPVASEPEKAAREASTRELPVFTVQTGDAPLAGALAAIIPVERRISSTGRGMDAAARAVMAGVAVHASTARRHDLADAAGTTRIRVVGVGGGGGNAVNTMIAAGLAGIDFVATNTDAQALRSNRAPTKVPLGESVSRGLGAGGNPEIGRSAAEADVDLIRPALAGADMVFVTAGMGGGTGTGASPVVGRLAKELGALTVGVVTKPFAFEGKRRMAQAEDGVRELAANVDTLIVVPNDRLLAVSGRNAPVRDTFKKADDVLVQAVRTVSELLTGRGLINVDFADLRAIMLEMGMAVIATGKGHGESGAVEAARQAISSPLLENASIRGARGVLVNITGGPRLALPAVNDAVTLVQDEADEEANIIFGAAIDDSMTDDVSVTVIATGLGPAAPAHGSGGDPTDRA